MSIPMAIFRGLDISWPLLFFMAENTSITRGVSVMTKTGFTACHISGAIDAVSTKSRANTDSDWPF